jgi:TonB family protein
MVEERKKREYTSFIAAILIHIVLLLLLPGIASTYITPPKKNIPIEVTTKFVELIYPKTLKEVKVIKKEEKQVVVSKSKGKELKIKEKKRESIVQSKTKFDENSLPEVNLNKELIKQKDSEKSTTILRKKNTSLADIDTGVYRTETPGLKDIRGAGELKSDIEAKSIKLKSKSEEEEGKEVSIFKGDIKDRGVATIDSPKGVSMEIAEGKGEAKWGRYKEPDYPEVAQNNGWSGKVGLIIKFDPRGNPQSIIVEEKSGYYELDESAKKAAKSWRIYITDSGIPVSGTVRIGIRFRLK